MRHLRTRSNEEEQTINVVSKGRANMSYCWGFHVELGNLFFTRKNQFVCEVDSFEDARNAAKAFVRDNF